MRTIIVAALLAAAASAPAQTLTGFAVLPADTFRPGPTSGQFIAPNTATNRAGPFVEKQPVQGFSGILRSAEGAFTILADNGFGARNNSSDFTLALHNVSIDPRRAAPGGGTTGAGTITLLSTIELSDPDRRIGYAIVADNELHPQDAAGAPGVRPAVAPSVRQNRTLTGHDLDIESLRRAPDGSYWIGDEFGPFLAHFDAQGRLLSAPVPLAGVASPSDPLGRPATHPGSGGYEGMSQSADGRLLHAMLERPTDADLAAGRHRLQINTFDTATGAYTGERRFYPLAAAEGGTHIGDFSPVTDNLHLVLERDGGAGPAARFKKLYLVDFARADPDGNLAKRELLDLLAIPDPSDLNADGRTVLSFPFLTIENVILLDDHTIAILNDNNYPAGGGRSETAPDPSEYIEIRFDQPLASFTVP